MKTSKWDDTICMRWVSNMLTIWTVFVLNFRLNCCMRDKRRKKNSSIEIEAEFYTFCMKGMIIMTSPVCPVT